MASTLFRAATIAASGNLDKEIITSKPQNIQKIASCYLVWLTNSISSHLCLLPILATLRLWNLESKTCVQEITAHRKKFDESIFDVAFHPSRPYIARCFLSTLFCPSQPFSLSVLARMPLLRSSSEDSQDLPLKTIKTSIVTLYRFKIIFR